jgi:hypothetical protein
MGNLINKNSIIIGHLKEILEEVKLQQTQREYLVGTTPAGYIMPYTEGELLYPDSYKRHD